MQSALIVPRRVQDSLVKAGSDLTAPRWDPGTSSVDTFLFERGGKTRNFVLAYHSPFDGRSNLEAIRTCGFAAWEPEYIHFGFFGLGERPNSSFVGRKHLLHMEDTVEVFLDVGCDGLEYAEIQASAYGALTEVYHSWEMPPSFPCNAIDSDQLSRIQMDREWILPGIQSHTKFLPGGDATEPVAWEMRVSIPVGPLLGRRGLPLLLEAGSRVRAHMIRYHYQNNADGVPDLVHLGWMRTTHGSPHVTPMAMGTIVCA